MILALQCPNTPFHPLHLRFKAILRLTEFQASSLLLAGRQSGLCSYRQVMQASPCQSTRIRMPMQRSPWRHGAFILMAPSSPSVPPLSFLTADASDHLPMNSLCACTAIPYHLQMTSAGFTTQSMPRLHPPYPQLL